MKHDSTRPEAVRPAIPATDGDAPSVPLAISGLTVSYGDMPAVNDVSVAFRSGAMTAIIGPNGAGKSTLLKSALGIVTPLSGQVTCWGRPLARQRHRIAYVPQRAAIDWEFPARALDVVLMGMYRELGLLRRVRASHLARAMSCLARVGMEDFADRQIGRLSGGQQQRVFLARALAQGADLYMLDEPFAGVDAATERAIIAVLKEIVAEGGTVIAVHHDLATVPGYFDRVFLMNVHAIAEGPVATAFSRENLDLAYGGRLAQDPVGAAGARDAY